MVNELALGARDIIRFVCVCVWSRVMFCFCFWCWFYYYFVCVRSAYLHCMVFSSLVVAAFAFIHLSPITLYTSIQTYTHRANDRHKRSAHQWQCLINIQHTTRYQEGTPCFYTPSICIVGILLLRIFLSVYLLFPFFVFGGSWEHGLNFVQLG